ncbi:MAG: caspase family protein [Pseudanabaenaceae cyanobacterium bins.39]|nr:caspase family protein [Pseudanabaenaceae cyanobacterium bins.39]
MQRKALVVGVSQYSKLRSLESFANNANAIADILEPTFKVKRLPEAVAGDRVCVGKGNILCDRLHSEIRDLFTATDLDTVLFYFSGHGVRGKQHYPKTYLATSESEVLDDGYRKSIEIDLLKQFLRDCPAREQIVWLDCCYGGDLADFREICDRNDGKTRFIITASRSQDPAYQEIAGEMGVFTRALLEALARTGATERRITCAAIEDAVREKLQRLQYPQMPQFYRTPNKIIEFWERRVMAEAGQDEVKPDKSEIPNTSIIQKALENVSAGGNINVQINQNVHQHSSSSEPVAKPSTSMNQNILRRKIEILKKEADAVLGQWESATSDEQRDQLWRRLEQKQAQIAEVERGLA